MKDLIKVLKAGPMLLLQDSGRRGFEEYGVSLSGAADKESYNVSNRLVFNNENDTVLEIFYGDVSLKFYGDNVIAISGGDLGAEINSIKCPLNMSFFVPDGSILKFHYPLNGIRSYLAISGGIETKKILGSRSMHVTSGIGGHKVKSGDILPIGNKNKFKSGFTIKNYKRDLDFGTKNIGVIVGQQIDKFSSEMIESFFNDKYILTDKSDRQGLRLSGNKIFTKNNNHDIISDPVMHGSIQITGSGYPIILMPDTQTTGGYPKIGNIGKVYLDVLAQLKAGDEIIFFPITPKKSREEYISKRSLIYDTKIFRDVKIDDYLVNGEDIMIGMNDNIVFTEDHAFLFNLF